MDLNKSDYWDRLIDHFYDHVKWESKFDNIYDWLESDYGMVSDTGSPFLSFDETDPRASVFIMKWAS